MRITFILPYAGMAGGIRVIAIYAQRLQQRGHKVLVVSTPWIPRTRRDRNMGFMRRLLYRLMPLTDGVPDPSHFASTDVEHVQLSEPRPPTDADLPDADVVMATWWETAAWVAKLSPTKGAKVYFVQDYGVTPGQPLDQIASTWRLPMHKITISRWLVTLMQEHCPACKVDYVPNAVDLELFHAPPRGKQARPTVGMVYSPAPQKGADIMAKAVRLARQSIPELHLVAYGPADPRFDPPLPAPSAFHRLAPDGVLKDIYSACDAWLFGSRREGFGLPILEAMACRTPVIATPAGAAPELLEHGGGVLVKPGDQRDMARAIMRLVTLPDFEWRRLSDAAYATATGYTWEDATSLFEAALHRAIAHDPQVETLVA